MVGRKYKAPDFIDSRMLEPKHAFRQDYEIEGGLVSLLLTLQSVITKKPAATNFVASRNVGPGVT